MDSIFIRHFRYTNEPVSFGHGKGLASGSCWFDFTYKPSNLDGYPYGDNEYCGRLRYNSDFPNENFDLFGHGKGRLD